MKSFVFLHASGCSPVEPCSHCRAVAYLREKLGENFQEFLDILGEPEESLSPTFSLDTELRQLPNYSALNGHVTGPLFSAEINTIRDLVSKTEPELLRTPGIGRTSLERFRVLLQGTGYQLYQLTKD